MAWKKVDNYHIRDGEWTISKAMNVPFPYALWFQKENRGYFTSAEDAKAAYMELCAKRRSSVRVGSTNQEHKDNEKTDA